MIPRRSTTAIGLDIGARYVKAVQLRRCGGEYRIAATTRMVRAADAPFDAGEAARVADVLDRQGFVGRRVVTALPAEKVMTSMVQLPATAGNAPLQEIARAELARVHNREADSFELAHWPVPPPARATKSPHVMAFACPHETAELLVDTLLSVNLFVDAIDLQTCALARAASGQVASGASDGLLTILDLGFSAARLAILHGGVVIYSRVIAQGGTGRLAGDLQQQVGLDPCVWEDPAAMGILLDSRDASSAEIRSAVINHHEQIAREVKASFSYAAHQYPDTPASRVLVTGGGGEIPGVVDQMSILLGQEVHLAAVECISEVGGVSPSMTLAAGLALYEEV